MKLNRFIALRTLALLLLLPLIYLAVIGRFVDPAPATKDNWENDLSSQDINQRGPSQNAEDIDFNASEIVSIGNVVTPTLSQPVSSLPQISADVLPELIREINPRVSHNLEIESQSNSQSERDLQTAFDENTLSPPPTSALPASSSLGAASVSATDVFTTPLLNFAGSPFTQVHPPDTVGAVGKNYYIQMVNASSGAQFRIYNKSGTLVQGPIALESLSSGDCSVGAGDPIVLYDQLASRWFMSEFRKVGGDRILCHYISQTDDPTGSWFAYEFEMPNFPDYPKYGLWPSAYIGSANEVGGSGAGPIPAIYAFDREKMLNGDPAGFIRFVPPRLSAFGFQAFTPVDLEGDLTPAQNSPLLYLRHRDDEVHNSSSNNSAADFIEIWSLSPDFDEPNNASFSQIANIPVSEFDSSMCGVGSFECVPQKGSFRLLDPVREVLMHRVQYFNHGTHESIVGNLVTDATGNNHHGLFWFELRNIGDGWVLHQDGTLAPDSEHRWMGSIAMDASQNIALLYNVSGNNTFPSLRYTGRTAAMPPGTLLDAEGSIAEGAAANASSRYGDYNSLTLDPIDGCTFWATGQFNAATAWATQIATLKFPECKNGASFALQKPSSAPEFLIGTQADILLSITASDSFTESVELAVSNLSSGSIIGVNPISISPIVTPTTITVSISGAELGEQSFLITGTSPEQTSNLQVNFEVVPGLETPVTLIKPSNGAKFIPTQPQLEWTAAAGATFYELELSVDPQFVTTTQTYPNISGTSFTPTIALANDQVTYWRVRPANAESFGPWATAVFQTEPMLGFCQDNQAPQTLHQTGFETDLSGWSVSGINSSWEITDERFSAGLSAIGATGHAFTSTQKLTSPILDLAPQTDIRWLSFDIWRDVELSGSSCHDGLILEIEKDGIWSTVGSSGLATDPYDFVVPDDANNVLQGNQAWCGVKDWTTSLVNLTDYSGSIRLRYHFATDTSVGREGVYIDNVHIYECNPRDLITYHPFIFKSE